MTLELLFQAEQITNNLMTQIVDFAARKPMLRTKLNSVLIDLNRLLGHLATQSSLEETVPIIDSIIKQLCKMIERERDNSRFVIDFIRELNRLTVITGLWSITKPPTLSSLTPSHRRDIFGVTYYVTQDKRGQELLVEHREKSKTLRRKNYRISLKDYNAAIAAMSHSRKLATFKELHVRFIESGGTKTRTGYPLRVVMRFWRSLSPQLIKKSGAKYQMKSRTIAQFQQKATQAWEANRIKQT